MPNQPAFVVDVPAVHREYDFLDPRTKLFDEKQKRQDWACARDLAPTVGLETAAEDSLVAYERWQGHPEEFPEGTSVVVFIGETEEDGVWYVARFDGELSRCRYSLDCIVHGNYRVARLRE